MFNQLFKIKKIKGFEVALQPKTRFKIIPFKIEWLKT